MFKRVQKGTQIALINKVSTSQVWLCKLVRTKWNEKLVSVALVAFQLLSILACMWYLIWMWQCRILSLKIYWNQSFIVEVWVEVTVAEDKRLEFRRMLLNTLILRPPCFLWLAPDTTWEQKRDRQSKDTVVALTAAVLVLRCVSFFSCVLIHLPVA